jgi:DNA-binding response OmpR family regulator
LGDPREAAAERRATRILIVDDDERILRLCARALGGAGYEVATVSDAVDGLAIALAGRHDLVVLDLTMPGLPGLAFLDRLIQGRPRTTVIVVSCLRDGRTRTWCRQLGAADYLSKPFTLGELLGRVELLTGGPSRPRNRRARVERLRVGGRSQSRSIAVH